MIALHRSWLLSVFWPPAMWAVLAYADPVDRSVARLASSPLHSESTKCEDARHREFDFWLGDWQVTDAYSKRLVGFDHIEKVLKGCVVQQRLVFLTDLYRDPKLDYRVSGMSVSAFDGEQWHMLWADDYGSVVLVRGGLQADGSMVFVTTVPSAGRYLRAVWKKNADGSVTNAGYRSKNGVDGWEEYFELEYRRNR